jgi:hypothetical protein
MVRPYFIEDEDYVIPTLEKPKSDDVVIEEPKEPEKDITSEATPEEQNNHKESPKQQAKKFGSLGSKKFGFKRQAKNKNNRRRRRR